MLKTLRDRASGILCHLSSLPGPPANGDLGAASHNFLDWLSAAGASWWQMLPHNPTGAGDSPYQALSAFAGNPLFVSPDSLLEQGWLGKSGAEDLFPGQVQRADFGASFEYRFGTLRLAMQRFEKMALGNEKKAFEEFCQAEAYWLEDWAFFAALKRAHRGRHWVEWDAALRDSQAEALAAERQRLDSEIRFERFVQFVFELQWNVMKSRAHALGIGLIGDLPIFVSHDSSDVWAHRELFDLDAAGHPRVVAGVPPDYFSEDGQRWGNPLYRWDLHRDLGYSWWIARFRRSLSLFDAVRIDHFIGFHRYWEIPAEAQSAKHGHYEMGPGASFFEALEKELGPRYGGHVPIIAEDLGVVTPDVTALRKKFSFPGMRVIQFCFGGEAEQMPDHIAEDVVAYTGTHDNDTTRGWLEDLGNPASSAQQRNAFRAERERALSWAKGKEQSSVWSLIAGTLECDARLAVTPLQDILELGTEARMNVPGTADGNWRWRAKPGSYSHELALRHRRLAERTRRL